MNKIFTLLIIVLFTISCKGQEYENKKFDLSKLNFDLKADKFYSKSMNSANIKFSSEKQYVEKDTISEYDLDWTGDKSKIFGVQFNVKKYSPKDAVAIYKNLIFFKLEAMTTEKGDLMLVSAIGKCSDKNFKIIVQKITDEYKKSLPLIEEKEFSFFKTYHYTWKLGDRTIELVSKAKINFDQTPYNILTEQDKKVIKETSEDGLNEIHLFICKKEFEEKIKGKMNTGDWSDFK